MVEIQHSTIMVRMSVWLSDGVITGIPHTVARLTDDSPTSYFRAKKMQVFVITAKF
jgi:hypothetical protein